MTVTPFRGVYPAITTPFHADGSIDFETLRADVRRLESAGVDGVVAVGSTGESATLSHDEHVAVVETAVDAADEVPVIAGTGSNSTREAVSLSERAADAGADALLLVSPYYNRPEQRGLLAHYRTVADALDLPQIVYNVPSRTGRSVDPDTVVELARHPNVAGYKAASGDLGAITEVVERTRGAAFASDGDAADADGEAFAVLSGDDALTLPVIAVGGRGVVSVAANVEPRRTTAMVHAALDGDIERARELHHRLGPLFRALFVETNPIPVKEALHRRGGHPPHLRSPLSRLDEDHRDDLAGVLADLADRPAPEVS